jgi:hypothetical protein
VDISGLDLAERVLSDAPVGLGIIQSEIKNEEILPIYLSVNLLFVVGCPEGRQDQVTIVHDLEMVDTMLFM